MFLMHINCISIHAFADSSSHLMMHIILQFEFQGIIRRCIDFKQNCYKIANFHITDSSTSAEREIKFFFPDFSFYKWHKDEEMRYRKGPIIFNNHLFQHVRKL